MQSYICHIIFFDIIFIILYVQIILWCCIYLSSMIYIIQVSLCANYAYMWPYSSYCCRAAAATLCSTTTCCDSPVRQCSQFLAAENASEISILLLTNSWDFLSTPRYLSLGIFYLLVCACMLVWTDIELPSYVAFMHDNRNLLQKWISMPQRIDITKNESYMWIYNYV